ncbi:MAG: hypothetical protein Athens071426_81, partial [Parcubacteria group bacterium Athens0714_26]
EVKKLQQILSNEDIVGQGIDFDPDNTTGYYGKLTMQAIQRFQAKYNIVSSGSPETTGYGAIGPKTINKLNQLVNAYNAGNAGGGTGAGGVVGQALNVVGQGVSAQTASSTQTTTSTSTSQLDTSFIENIKKQIRALQELLVQLLLQLSQELMKKVGGM